LARGNPRVLKELETLTVEPRLEGLAEDTERIEMAMFIKLLTDPFDVFFAAKLVG
jgi:hypothetical protein